MMTAAMASSSHKRPVVPDADPKRGTYRIVAMATQIPWKTYVRVLMRSTGMAEYRATISLDPIARQYRPNLV